MLVYGRMMFECLVATYRIPEPFEKALRLVRDAIVSERLSVCDELDVSARIKQELGIALAPCRALSVDCPVLLLRAVALDGAAALLLPSRVVVCAQGPQTVVHVPRLVDCAARLTEGADASVVKVHHRLSRALRRTAMRDELRTVPAEQPA